MALPSTGPNKFAISHLGQQWIEILLNELFHAHCIRLSGVYKAYTEKTDCMVEMTKKKLGIWMHLREPIKNDRFNQ